MPERPGPVAFLEVGARRAPGNHHRRQRHPPHL